MYSLSVLKLYVLLEFKNVVSIFSSATQNLIISTVLHLPQILKFRESKISNFTDQVPWQSSDCQIILNSVAIHWGGKHWFFRISTLCISLQRCQQSLMFNSCLKSLLKFYCFCEVIILIPQCHKTLIFTYTGHLRAEHKRASIKFIRHSAQ